MENVQDWSTCNTVWPYYPACFIYVRCEIWQVIYKGTHYTGRVLYPKENNKKRSERGKHWDILTTLIQTAASDTDMQCPWSNGRSHHGGRYLQLVWCKNLNIVLYTFYISAKNYKKVHKKEIQVTFGPHDQNPSTWHCHPKLHLFLLLVEQYTR